MVHLETLERMREHYKQYLEQYVTHHPGEFILIEGRPLNPLKVTFYKTEGELKGATEKYEGRFGPTFLVEQIPTKTHRFKRDNKTLEFLDIFVEVCPNDRETLLLERGPVMISGTDDKTRYQELAYCPDCGYRVFRRPSEERIEKVEQHMQIPIR